MTHITIDRATVEQALEALENAEDQLAKPYSTDASKAVVALRAALAQQAEAVQVAERERIATQWDGCVTHQLDTFGPVDIGASIRAGELVGPAQQAEPVAVFDERMGCPVLLSGAPMLKDEQPLYTAPPQRKPLTDEEIVDAVRDADLDWQAGWTLDEHEPNRFTTLARAVERKVRGEERC